MKKRWQGCGILPETFDANTLFSMALLNDLIGGSQQIYHDVQATLQVANSIHTMW